MIQYYLLPPIYNLPRGAFPPHSSRCLFPAEHGTVGWTGLSAPRTGELSLQCLRPLCHAPVIRSGKKSETMKSIAHQSPIITSCFSVQPSQSLPARLFSLVAIWPNGHSCKHGPDGYSHFGATMEPPALMICPHCDPASPGAPAMRGLCYGHPQLCAAARDAAESEGDSCTIAAPAECFKDGML